MSIDISPHAVAIMERRGLEDVHRADIFAYEGGGPFDTVLMMGHGICMVETIAGLDRFLDRAQRLLSCDGMVLLDSVDVRATDDEKNLAYHEANRRAGRYIGEVRLQLKFHDSLGPWCGWLHVDPETLNERAKTMEWKSEVVREERSGDYLARLTKASA